jgi:uncharacterized membrane protein
MRGVWRDLATVGAGILILLASLLLPWVDIGDTVHLGDVRHYYVLAHAILHGQVPYHDFFVDYPPGALPALVAPALITHGVSSYGVAFQWFIVALTILLVLAVIVALQGRAPRWAVLLGVVVVCVSPALIGRVYLVRFDMFPALLTAVALSAVVKGRYPTAGIVLGVAGAAKVYPVMLVPLVLLVALHGDSRRRAVQTAAGFVAAFGALVVPFLVLGAGGVAYSFKVQFTRLLEIESIGASILLCAHQLGAYTPHVHEGFSFELTGSLPALVGDMQTVLLALCVGTAWLLFRRSRRDSDTFLLAAAAVIAGVITFDKVLSPQYLVWLVPMMALISGMAVARMALPLFALASVLTASYFPSRFGDLRHLGDSAWIVLARNLVLVVLTFVLLESLRRRSASPEPSGAISLDERPQRRSLFDSMRMGGDVAACRLTSLLASLRASGKCATSRADATCRGLDLHAICNEPRVSDCSRMSPDETG